MTRARVLRVNIRDRGPGYAYRLVVTRRATQWLPGGGSEPVEDVTPGVAEGTSPGTMPRKDSSGAVEVLKGAYLGEEGRIIDYDFINVACYETLEVGPGRYGPYMYIGVHAKAGKRVESWENMMLPLEGRHESYFPLATGAEASWEANRLALWGFLTSDLEHDGRTHTYQLYLVREARPDWT